MSITSRCTRVARMAKCECGGNIEPVEEYATVGRCARCSRYWSMMVSDRLDGM
jgi:hypothetical protein